MTDVTPPGEQPTDQGDNLVEGHESVQHQDEQYAAAEDFGTDGMGPDAEGGEEQGEQPQEG